MRVSVRTSEIRVQSGIQTVWNGEVSSQVKKKGHDREVKTPRQYTRFEQNLCEWSWVFGK